MLKRVIEHRDRRPLVRCPLHAGHAIRGNDHGDIRIERAVYERLVLAIPAQHDRRPRTTLGETACHPCSHRRLSRSTNAHVPNTQRRQRGLLRLDHYETTAFDLDHANEAVAHAAAKSGPFNMTVIRPQPA